jgi:hypothetical protein
MFGKLHCRTLAATQHERHYAYIVGHVLCAIRCSGYEGYPLRAAEGPTAAGKVDSSVAATLARAVMYFLGEQQASNTVVGTVKGKAQPATNDTALQASEFKGASTNTNASLPLQPLVNETSDVLPTRPADPERFVNDTNTVSCVQVHHHCRGDWFGQHFEASAASIRYASPFVAKKQCC